MNAQLQDAFPLQWPRLTPRTPEGRRKHGAFRSTLGKSRDEVIAELLRMNAIHIVLSTNMPVRKDGFLYATAAEPSDPGVAVYFARRVGTVWKPFCVACDQYDRVWKNCHAIALTLAALRSVERWGSASMIEQVFTGFSALPAPTNEKRPWREVLGWNGSADRAAVRARRDELARLHHPDRGGSHERMTEINVAWEDYEKENLA